MTTDTIGGVWTFTLELAKHLTRLGVEVVLAGLGGAPSDGQVSELRSTPEILFLTSDFKLEWMEGSWRDVEESGRWLLRLEQEYKPDVVHLNSFGHGGMAWTVPVVLTAHSCVLSWWKAVKNELAPAAWNLYRDLVTRSLNSVDLVVSPTTAMAATLVSNYESRGWPSVVIPNGRADGLFRSATKQPFVLTAGRLWDEAKNVAAVARLATAISWPVYAAGEAEHPDGGTAFLKGAHLLGRLPSAELAEWLSRASIFALPARYEPFGLSALEAGLSGCALVLGDIPSLREVWGDAALFVAPEDEAGLAAAIESLISDVSLRQEMARRSHARALTFKVSKMADLYLAAYRSAFTMRSLPCAS